MLLALLCDDYVALRTEIKSPETVRLLHTSVTHFSTFLRRDATVADLTDRNLTSYVQYRRSLGRTDTTIEREVAKLYTLANFAALEGYIKAPRTRPFKARVDTPIGFTPAELRRLFRAAKRYDSPFADVPGSVYMPALVYVFWDSLERSGSVWRVEASDIELGIFRGWITFRNRKGSGRTLRRRLRWRTVRYLRLLLRCYPHPKPFGRNRDRTTLYHHWGKLLAAAGIPEDRHHGPHCIRRTGGSMYQRAGGRAQTVLDHSDESTTRKYYLVPAIIGEAQPTDRLRDPLGLWSRLCGILGL